MKFKFPVFNCQLLQHQLQPIKNNIRLAAVLGTAFLVLTSCSPDAKTRLVEPDLTTTAITATNTQGSGDGITESVPAHDFRQVHMLVGNSITMMLNAFDNKVKPEPRYTLPGFLSLPTTLKDIKKIEVEPDHFIYFLRLSDVTEVYNAFNRSEYQQADVVNDVENLCHDFRFEFEKRDEASSDYSDAEFKQMLKSLNSVIYFAKDKMFVYQLVSNLGGSCLPEPVPTHNWYTVDDRLIVPMVNPCTNDLAVTVTLRLNNKNYNMEKGEVVPAKSLYYIEEIKIAAKY